MRGVRSLFQAKGKPLPTVAPSKVTGRSRTMIRVAVNATSWTIGQCGAGMSATVREWPLPSTTR